MSSVFSVCDPYCGLSPRIRRSIGQMDLEAPHVTRVKAACVGLKYKVVSPAVEGEALAHIGIPALKVAIYFRAFRETARIAKVRAAWEAVGWKLFAATLSSIEKLTDAELVEQLGMAVKELRKK